MEIGYNSILWDGRNENNTLVSNGRYFYILQDGDVWLKGSVFILR